MFTMVNAMQWAIRTVIQRANAITLVKDKIKMTKVSQIQPLRLSIVTCKLSTVMGSYTLYRDMYSYLE